MTLIIVDDDSDNDNEGMMIILYAITHSTFSACELASGFLMATFVSAIINHSC